MTQELNKKTLDTSHAFRTSSQQAFSWKNDTWVKPYFGRYKKTLFLALFLGVLTIGFASALMFTAGWLIGGSAEMPYSILLLGTPLLCVRIFGIGKPLLQYAERLTSHNWVLRMTSSLRVKLYRSFDTQGIFFHSLYRLGDTLGLLAEDIGHIQNLYLRTIFPVVIAWILGLALVIGFGLFTWWMGVLVFVLLALELFVVPLVSASVNGARQAKHKALKASLYTEIADNTIGITDWILSGRYHDYAERHHHIQDALRTLEREEHAFDKRRDVILQFLFALGAVIVLLWAAASFSGQVGGNSNWILAFVLGYFPLIDAFAPLPAAATEARAHQDSVQRLNELPNADAEDTREKATRQKIIETIQETEKLVADAYKAENSNFKSTCNLNSGCTPNSKLACASSSDCQSSSDSALSSNSAYDIQLSNVSFSYKHDGRLLLDNLSLCIPAKQKIAILGKSGAGKSTLASLIRGDLTPTSGAISLVAPHKNHAETSSSDEAQSTPTLAASVKASTIPASATSTETRLLTHELGDKASQYFGVIQQKTYVFNTTLRNNLLIGNPNASDDLLKEILHKVGLGPLLERLPKGLDTIVDEAGLRFSGGERHRVALARVLLQDAPIVILDEPMVGLDPVTEQHVLDAIFSTLQNKTIIMITHHLQGVGYMDRVLFLENGHLKLDGHPQELAQTSTYFQQLLSLEQNALC